MKSIDKVLNLLPKTIYEQDVNLLSEQEKILLHVIECFKNPEHITLNMNQLMNLDKEYLIIVLQAIYSFYAEDSYVLQGSKLLIIDKKNPLINQSIFATLLQEHGLNFDKRKLNVYYSRGNLPTADIEIQGKPYWFKSTAEDFIKTKYSSLSYNSYGE